MSAGEGDAGVQEDQEGPVQPQGNEHQERGTA